MIPKGWKLKTFSDIVDIIGGGTPKTTMEAYWEGEIPWLSVVDFNNEFRTVNETEKSITEMGLNNSSTKILKKGELIISARGTVGAIAQLGRDMAFNQSCYGLRAIKTMTDNDFIYYLLKYSLNILKQTTHGSTFDTITKNTFDLLKVPLPPMKEQIKIASILSVFDDKIELNHRMNQTLEAIGQAIFRHWFVHFEFPNSEGQPYKSSGGEMVDSELGEIPKGWEIGKLGDLISITSGKRPKEKSEKQTIDFKIPLIGASSLMGYVKETLYNKPILVIGRVGTHGIIQKITPPSYPSDNTLVITSKYYEFVYQILRRIDYDSLNVGTTQPLITQKSIKNQEIIIPSQKILFTHENIISSLSIKMMENNSENEYLSKIRDYLLPKLMSGKIRVNIPEEATVK
ncbi:MAG: restriction endonuclease subunit S [Methanobacterium sp.]|nr:restriction endonuclease subunit S [Methanobacterium sp.]